MLVYTPIVGNGWNPLRKFRNIPCPCGSNKKSKKCHGMSPILPNSDIKKIKDYLRKLSAMGIIETSFTDIEDTIP